MHMLFTCTLLSCVSLTSRGRRRLIMIFIMHMHIVYNIDKWSYSIWFTQLLDHRHNYLPYTFTRLVGRSTSTTPPLPSPFVSIRSEMLDDRVSPLLVSRVAIGLDSIASDFTSSRWEMKCICDLLISTLIQTQGQTYISPTPLRQTVSWFSWATFGLFVSDVAEGGGGIVHPNRSER